MAQEDFNQFVERIKQAESRGRRFDEKGRLLTSPKGAEGEMQVMRGTQKSPGYGVEPAKDKSADEIARVGVDYLAAMEKKYGDRTLAAIAYNMGPGATDKWIAKGSDFSKLPAETRDYVQKVMGSAPATATAAPAQTPSEKMMEGALKSGMTAKAATPPAIDVAALGKDYKAALALSFLSGQDDIDEDTIAKFREREEEAATDQKFAPKPINALAELDLTSAPQTQFFAKGGEADSEEGLIPDEPPVHTIRSAHRMQMGDKDLENMMLGLGIDKATIGVNLSNMRQGDKNQLAQSLMAAYNDKFGDVGVNAAVMRPADAPPGVYMGNLGASYPVGQGRVMAGVNAMRTPEGETRTMGHTLGYSGKVGPGYLNATVMQPKGFPQGRQYQMQYAIPFADGGDVMDSNTPLNFNPLQGTGAMMMSHGGPVHRADGSPEEGEVTGVNKLVDFIAQRLNPSSFPTSARTLLETVQGNKGPITESNFSPEEHEVMRQLATLKGGKQGNIDYGDYVKLGEQMKKAGKIPASVTPGLLSMADPLGNIQTTLGRFSYQTDPKGNLQVVDKYDFNPIYDQGAMQEAQTGDYGALSPYGLVRNYAGQKIPPGKGREVLINLGPVKRADGSPEQGEIGFFNPNIQRQGAKARALAQKRDVNLLPDPKTYAAVSGLMGTPPDQMGFSVLHPQYREIQQVADPAFWMGTALGVAPAVSLAGKGVSKAARMLEDVTVGNAQRQRIREAGQLAQNLPSTVYDPLRERLQAQGSLAYAVREPGGPLLQVPQRTSHTWVDNKTGKALEQVDPLIPIMHDLAGTPDQPLNDWFRNKVGSYIRRDMGTEKDQFVKAADEGRRLHFVDKPPSSMTMAQASRETPHSVRHVRESEGFPAEGFAQTPYGRMVEAKTDWSIWPMEAKTLLGDEDEKLLLPIVRDMAKQNPNLRVHEINPQIEEHLGLTSLRDKMFKMRQMSPDFAAYNQPAVKIPERYMFTDKTLQGLTPAQASERVAQFDAWKQETKQKMASQAVLKDPAVDRTPASNGHVWVNAPDLEDNPALRNLIQDVGCDGGWCTKTDYQAVNNGSGPNRLSVLMDSKARPKVQMTVTTKSPTTDDFLTSMGDDEVDAFKANNPDVALYDDNSIRSTPEYQQWARVNPESVSITELKAVNNQIDMKDAPFLKQVQDRIKQLDAQVGLQHVDNLDGIGMTDLTSQLYGHSSVANRPKIGQQNMMWIADEAARLNGGSRYVEKDKGVIDSLLQQAADNILGPEGHAIGGLIERQNTDNRRYL